MSAAAPAIHPRDQIAAAMDRIYRYKMTTTSGGNLSIREAGGDVWITPAKVDKGDLRAADVAVIGADGQARGTYPPSSESPLHLAVYAARPEARAIVHAHSAALLTFAMCHAVPDLAALPAAARACGPVGYAPYEITGSAALGERVGAVFAGGADCVLMENHGVVVVGVDLAQAFARFELLEMSARTLLKALALGPVRYPRPEALAPAGETHRDLDECDAGAPAAAEVAARAELAGFAQRCYRQRLATASQGTLSVRLEGDAFLITPAGMDRATLRPEDVVLIQAGRRARGGAPPEDVRWHQAIYQRHAEVGAIAAAAPLHATAFSVTDAPFGTHGISESFVLLRDVVRIPFAAQSEDGAEVAARVSPAQPAALLENRGVLVLGRALLEAFDRLEVLEGTAETLLNARALGPVCPIPPARITELARVFLK